MNLAPKAPPPTPPAFIADATEPSSPIPLPRVIKKWIPIMKTVGPALIALVFAVTDARTGKHEVSEKTDTAYETLAPSTNANSKRIKKMEESIAKLADTVELQGKLLLAMQPGFTTAGIPAPAPATPPTRKKVKHVVAPADPALVKKVQVQAVKTLAEIKQRAADPAPVAVPVPATIPAQPPPPPTPPPASAPMEPAKTSP